MSSSATSAPTRSYFTPSVFKDSLPGVNRLQVIDAYVRQGGALLMVGGYLSFSGIEGKAHYAALLSVHSYRSSYWSVTTVSKHLRVSNL